MQIKLTFTRKFLHLAWPIYLACSNSIELNSIQLIERYNKFLLEKKRKKKKTDQRKSLTLVSLVCLTRITSLRDLFCLHSFERKFNLVAFH